MNHLRATVFATLVLAATVLSQGQAEPRRAGPAGWVENLSYSAAATASWVEDISRTSYAPTRKNAATYEFALGASGHRQLASSWLFEYGADADYLAVPDYELTNHFTAGPRLALQHKFGLGPLAPVLQFNAAYTYKAARFAGDRGWTAEGGMRLAQRLSSSVKVAVSGQWLRHDADSATFGIQQRTLTGEVTWDLSDRWRLNVTAGRLYGTLVANAAWSVWATAITGGFGPAVYDYYTVIPWSVTNLYGAGWVSYKVGAHADLWSASLAYALSDRTSLELRTSSAFVINHVGVRYPTDSWGLGLQHRF
jgi:hypothetical protein